MWCFSVHVLIRGGLVIYSFFSKKTSSEGETRPLIHLRRFMNPYVKLWIPLRFFWPRESCGLDFSVGKWSEKERALFRWARRAADPIDASLIACASSLFSCLSSPGGETGFFIWIVTVRNGFGGVLVSCCPTQFVHITTLCTLLHEAQNYRDPFECTCTKMQLWSAAARGMHVSSTVAAIQNDISSKRLPLSTHAMFVYTWITHHSSCLFVSDDGPNCWTIYWL